MITKERLQELIEQGATIWAVYDYSYNDDGSNQHIEYINLDVFYHYYKSVDSFIKAQGSYSMLFETEEEAQKYMLTKQKMKKGDVVWFVDGGCENGKMFWYAEYGTIKEISEDDYFVIGSYFGDFGIAKDRLFKTKEDCEKFIKEKGNER